MKIQHSNAALNSYRNLANNNNAVSKNLDSLSPDHKINHTENAAAVLVLSDKIKTQIRSLQTAQENAQNGISPVGAAQGALAEIHTMLKKMEELAGQSANGTYDNEAGRPSLQKEMSSLRDGICRIFRETDFNGFNLQDTPIAAQNIYDGAAAPGEDPMPQIGNSTKFTYLPAICLSLLGIGLLDISSQEGAREAIAPIKKAINYIAAVRSHLDANKSRLDRRIDKLSVTAKNMTAAENQIRDIDMANEMMSYLKNNILVQSSQAMQAQANQIPQDVLQLLIGTVKLKKIRELPLQDF